MPNQPMILRGAIGCEMDGPKESPTQIALRYRRRAKQAKFAASRIRDRELSLTFLHIAEDYDLLASLREPPKNPG